MVTSIKVMKVMRKECFVHVALNFFASLFSMCIAKKGKVFKTQKSKTFYCKNRSFESYQSFMMAS